MKIVSYILVLLVAILHIYFLILEMFLWNHPIGYKIFATTPEFATASTVLAMNQGLYNGFLAAGLIFGLMKKNFTFKVFFLSCIIVAGVFGALTVKVGILFVQAVPALLALIFVLLAKKYQSN
ncbi:MAG: putative membrane protein [Gammaproteobacteria bacterium]|jgi:putative membrane protein